MPPQMKFPGPVPKEALSYFRRKGLKIGMDYTDVWLQEHGISFTVAKIAEIDVLKDVRRIVQRAIEKGTTFQQFQKEITPLLDRSGWSNYHKDKPKKARLRTIFDTNMRVARAVGQWQRIERTKNILPYLVYSLGPSVRHRPEHESWEGTTLPVDDPWWDSHTPPSGYL